VKKGARKSSEELFQKADANIQMAELTAKEFPKKT